MRGIALIKGLFLLILAIPVGKLAFAQGNEAGGIQHLATTPVDVRHDGWNKVLQMSSGNTVLIHFERPQDLVIKTFDAAHKELATVRPVCKRLDERLVNENLFKGFYEIDGHAVLFMQQVLENRQCLIRMIIDPVSAKVLDEKVVFQSKSFREREDFYIMKPDATDGYAVFRFRDVAFSTDRALLLCIFNEQHEILKTAALNIPADEISNMWMLGSECSSGGAMHVALYYRRVEKDSGLRSYVMLASLYGVDKTFRTKLIAVDNSVVPQYILFNRDVSSPDESAMVVSTVGIVKGGLHAELRYHFMCFMMNINVATDEVWRITPILSVKNDIKLGGEKKLLADFNGAPMMMFSNTPGQTNIICQNIYGLTFDYAGIAIFRDIAISVIDTALNETGSGMISIHQNVSTATDAVDFLRSRAVNTWMGNTFADLRHMPGSFECLTHGSQTYILYNDDSQNYRKAGGVTLRAVENYAATDVVAVMFDGKNRHPEFHLFPADSGGHHRLELASGSYDSYTGTYAVMSRSDQEGKTTEALSWFSVK